MRVLADRLASVDGRLIVAGDVSGPSAFDLPRAKFCSLVDQQQSGFALASKLPVRHYARKNIAYLEAMRAGASCIYETDDDNQPNGLWAPRSEVLETVEEVATGGSWVNIYRYFTDANIWPRGLPLDQIQEPIAPLRQASVHLRAPIQQGLINKAPDVDAIWRLVFADDFEFDAGLQQRSVYLRPGQWCPFNTQSTWWWPIAFPLLYVPSYCSFRMCDIWKSFIAQRCLWELGLGVVFHGPEADQDRNEHRLMSDFEDEISGYRANRRIAEILENLSLLPSEQAVAENLFACYEGLTREGIFPVEELELLELWMVDCQECRSLSGTETPVLLESC